MNLKQLEVFLAVVETGNFSRASAATFITQSTVSQHIASLEAEFELKLLDRTGKAALPTEAGKLLLTYARQIVSKAKEAPLAMKKFRGLEESTILKVGASNIPGNYLVPAVLPIFTRRYPGVSVTVREGDSRETLESLKKEEFEVGIIGTLFKDKSTIFHRLGPDKIVLVVKSDHRWAEGKAISPGEMLTERFIIREVGSGTDKTVHEALLKIGIRPEQVKVQASLGSNEAVKQAVLKGMGVAFISKISIEKELGNGEVAVVKIKGLTISRFFYLIRRRKRGLSPPALAFVNFLVEMHNKDLLYLSNS